MENRGIVKSGEITGAKVMNSAHEDLGEIAEVVIDKESGKVNYLVLDFGGFLGFGNKFFAVPWNLFLYNNKEDCFVLNVDKERLKKAPGFDKDHWPNFSAAEFKTTISGFYTGDRQ
ncbi:MULTISPECIES: PRC-barrel domain-containing protein [unclassified Legionella]|uniref:PRC-barrel domain-containing protein n=1 Tax=Legionella sp. PC997 TaxID=2755562 RepID=UPI0015FC940C|nr:PRC-barrel domain-containing protein [Legionella sp. PC997]QMT61039.1 photosystem reaction center subunit H [Legionella sp. PC997]